MKKTLKQIAHEAHQEHIENLDPYFRKRLVGLTVKQINERADNIRRKQREKERTLSKENLLGLVVDLADCHGYWHGPKCRSCECAPNTLGEVSLALYSSGDWICNECYSFSPDGNDYKKFSLIQSWDGEVKKQLESLARK